MCINPCFCFGGCKALRALAAAKQRVSLLQTRINETQGRKHDKNSGHTSRNPYVNSLDHKKTTLGSVASVGYAGKSMH